MSYRNKVYLPLPEQIGHLYALPNNHKGYHPNAHTIVGIHVSGRESVSMRAWSRKVLDCDILHFGFDAINTETFNVVFINFRFIFVLLVLLILG